MTGIGELAPPPLSRRVCFAFILGMTRCADRCGACLCVTTPARQPPCAHADAWNGGKRTVGDPRWPPIINRKLNKVTLFRHLTRAGEFLFDVSKFPPFGKGKIGFGGGGVLRDWKLNFCILASIFLFKRFHRKFEASATGGREGRFWNS